MPLYKFNTQGIDRLAEYKIQSIIATDSAQISKE